MAVEKVVVHYRDGRILKGFVEGFAGTEASIRVESWQDAAARTDVDLSALKALFFVKDFIGDSTYDEVKAFRTPPAGAERRMEVTLFDGELLIGTVTGFHPERDGFFLEPADPDCNNTRCFIVAAAVHRASVV